MRVAARRREIRGSGGRGDRRPARLGVRITRDGHRKEIRSSRQRRERSMATEESKLKGARGEKQKQTNEARLR